MKKTSTRTVAIILSVLILLFVSACSNSKDSPKDTSSAKETSAPKETVEASAKKVTLSILYTGQQAFYETLTNAYKVLNPNISFDLQVVDNNQYDTLLRTKIATKTLPDIVFHNVSDMEKRYNPQENFVDLSQEAWTSRLANADFIKVKGAVYMYPYAATGGPMGIVYNRKIFSDLSIAIPKTFDELIQVSEKIKASGITPFFFGNKDAWLAQIGGLTTMGEYTKGTDILEKINTNKMKHADVKGFETALTQVTDIVKKGYANKDFMSVGFDAMGPALDSGKYAMAVVGDFVQVKDKNNFGLFATPSVNDPDVTVGTVTGLFIPKESKNLEEAKKFLQFMALPENATIIQKETQYIPAFKDSESDINQMLKDVNDNYISKGKIIRQYNDQIAVDTSELHKLYQDMYAGGKTPKQVWKAWDKKVADLAATAKLPGW